MGIIKKIKMKKQEQKINALLKTVLVFIIYLIYTNVVSDIAILLNYKNNIIVSFIADIIFLIFILIMYRDKIKHDQDFYHDDNSFKKRLIKALYWVLIICAADLIGSIVSMVMVNNPRTENNIILLSLPFAYKLFKTLIFSSIVEELVVKQSIRDVIDNNVLFIIVSTLVYSSMNIVYTDLSGVLLFANIIPYALFSLVTCVMYIKNKDNIYMVMIVKIIYTVIPLLLMLTGVVK